MRGPISQMLFIVAKSSTLKLATRTLVNVADYTNLIFNTFL